MDRTDHEWRNGAGKFCAAPFCLRGSDPGDTLIFQRRDLSFPNTIAIRGNMDLYQPILGLVGSREPIDLSSEFLTGQLQSDAVQRLRGECPFFRSLANFRLLLVGDLRAVAPDFERFALNTNDYPVIAFNGPRPIQPGQRFLKTPFPSCHLGNTPPEEFLAGIRARKYLYAASISAAPLPVSAEKQIERARQTMEHLETASRISPRNDFQHAELGR